MTISYWEYRSADTWRFINPHWVRVQVANDRWLVILTGVVIVDFQGTTTADWRRDRLDIGLNFPYSFLPARKYFQIEHWAPFATINAVYNRREAIDAGWAIDAFGGPGARTIRETVRFWADMAVRDADGIVHRVGYTLTVSGRIVDEPVVI